MRVRKVKNSAGNTSIQVGFYKGKNFQLVKHLGSAKNSKQEKALVKIANKFINKDQPSLFDANYSIDSSDFLPIGYSRKKAYEYFSHAFDTVFPKLTKSILKDLAIIRIINPTSKLESIELLAEYFGIKYSYASVYRELVKLKKEDLTDQLINYAQTNLAFNFSLLFYDVTTLYFESQRDETLKIPGFSKDGKHSNPQIMIGLVVDINGFPIFYEIFKGNSFEGHTMLPVILNFQKRFNVQNLTVVADSAMLSEDNLLALEVANLNYIVGNRTMSTYKVSLEHTIKELKLKDGATIRIKDDNRFIIYNFSKKREQKDLYEIQKATKKAEYLSSYPSKRSRSKYLRITNEKSEVNFNLIEKHKFLAGIKSYKTNIKIPARLVVERYSDLWKIEKSFRMTKHDLKARPIFHRKEDPIKAHIQVVFAANAVARHIELNTDKSIRHIVKELMREIQFEFKLKNSDTIFNISFKPH